MVTSIETKAYPKGNYFIVRHWDGYDRPEYFRCFEITDEEIYFRGGRFRNKNPVGPDARIVKLKDTSFLKDAIDWVSDNDIQSWNIEVVQSWEHGMFFFKFYFRNEDDAILFKLRWL